MLIKPIYMFSPTLCIYLAQFSILDWGFFFALLNTGRQRATWDNETLLSEISTLFSRRNTLVANDSRENMQVLIIFFSYGRAQLLRRPHFQQLSSDDSLEWLCWKGSPGGLSQLGSPSTFTPSSIPLLAFRSLYPFLPPRISAEEEILWMWWWYNPMITGAIWKASKGHIQLIGLTPQI